MLKIYFKEDSQAMEAFFEWFATSTAGGTFLTIGIIGIILLLISVLLDGVFEFLSAGDGPLSLTTIAAFGSTFGFGGYATIGAGGTPAVASLVGVSIGLVGGVLAWLITRFFSKATTSAAISSSTVDGTIASVILRIPGDEYYGEISFSRNGQRFSFAALAQEPIPVGSTVEVVTVLSESSVMVRKVQEDENISPDKSDKNI